MHRSGDIKTSMMSGIDRLTRRPVFVNSLPAPPHMTNAFGKQDFQQKYESLPGISQAYNEYEEDETHDTTQVNFGYQDYAEGDASLHTTPNSRSNNGSSNGFPVKHVYQSPNRSVGENAKLGYGTGINDIRVGGVSRPGFQCRNIVKKPVTNVMKNIIANTACVDRTFITGTVRDLSLYGKQSVIPGISKKSQNQEENKSVTVDRSHPSCAAPPNKSMSVGVNSQTNATRTLYGKQPVIPGINRNTQNQDLNCGMIKRVQSSYALAQNPDMLLEMKTNTAETKTAMEAIANLETHSLYGKQSEIPGISKRSQNQDNLNNAMIKRVKSGYSLSPSNDMLLEKKTDALQTQEQNCCDEVKMMAQSCYKLEPKPDTRLEIHINGEETNTEYAAKHGPDIEISNACQSLEEANEASPAPCSGPLTSSTYDQGHINIAEERLAEMLNENDNDKYYSEHVSEVRNNITSCERRELVREDDSISINVAYSYETSQNEKSKSAESDTNMESDTTNVIVPIVKTDDALNHKSDTTGNELAPSERENSFKIENTSDAEASCNKASKIVIEHKDHKKENVTETSPTIKEISTSFHEMEQKVALVDTSDDNTTREKSSSQEARILKATVIVANPESVKRKHRKRKADREKRQTGCSGDKCEFKKESTQSISANMKQKSSSDKTSSTKESFDTDDDIDKVPDDILDDGNNSKLDTNIQHKYRGAVSAKTVIHKENEARLNQKKINKELDYKNRCDIRKKIDKSTQIITKSFEKRIGHAPVNGNDVNANDICLDCIEHWNAFKNRLDFKRMHFLQSNLIDVSSLPAAFQPLKVWENEQTIKTKYMYKKKNHNNDNISDFNVPLNGKFNAATSKPVRSDVYMQIMDIMETKIGPERSLHLMRNETITEMLKNMDKNPMKYGFSYAHVVNFRDNNIYKDINKLICDPTIEYDDSVTRPRFKQEQLRVSVFNDNKPTLTVPESDRGCKDFCYSTYVNVEHDRNAKNIKDSRFCDSTYVSVEAGRNTKDITDTTNMFDASCQVKPDSDGGISCMDEDNTSKCETMKSCSSINCKDNDQIPKTKQKKSDKIKSFLRSLICICKPKIDKDDEDTKTL